MAGERGKSAFLLFHAIQPELFLQKLFHLARVSGVDRPIRVIYTAVIEHQLCVVHENVHVWVLIRFEFMLHCAEVLTGT